MDIPKWDIAKFPHGPIMDFGVWMDPDGYPTTNAATFADGSKIQIVNSGRGFRWQGPKYVNAYVGSFY